MCSFCPRSKHIFRNYFVHDKQKHAQLSSGKAFLHDRSLSPKLKQKFLRISFYDNQHLADYSCTMSMNSTAGGLVRRKCV